MDRQTRRDRANDTDERGKALEVFALIHLSVGALAADVTCCYATPELIAASAPVSQ